MGESISRFEVVDRDGTREVVEWRKVATDDRYEISSDGVLRRIDTKRVQKDQTKFRYYDGSVRRSISVRKLKNMAWSDTDSEPKLRRRG